MQVGDLLVVWFVLAGFSGWVVLRYEYNEWPFCWLSSCSSVYVIVIEDTMVCASLI